MRKTILCSILLFGVAAGAANAATSTTCYLDGALVSHELKALKGAAELVLPTGYVPNSLRVKTLDGRLDAVELLSPRRDPKSAKKIAALRQRKELLEDRLKGLEAREEIFQAAAKSQSGKGLRRSKNNPEPLEAVKEGTNFALDQLETVYRRRRVTERDLQQVTRQLADAEKAAPGPVARIRCEGKSGRFVVSYLRSDLKWQPSYAVRRRSGTTSLEVTPSFPVPVPGVVTVAPAKVGEAERAPVWRQFPVVMKAAVAGSAGASRPVPITTIHVENGEGFSLPPGEVTCFDNGDFVGKGEMKELKPGEKTEVLCGRHG